MNNISKFINPIKHDELEYIILGGKKDGERGVCNKNIDSIYADCRYNKKQIGCGGYMATFFVSSHLGDISPGECLSMLCSGYRKV